MGINLTSFSSFQILLHLEINWKLLMFSPTFNGRKISNKENEGRIQTVRINLVINIYVAVNERLHM